MRRAAVLVLALVTIGLGGCMSKPAPAQSPPDPVDIAVYMRTEVTEPQKQAIEAHLRGVAGVSGVTFETREQAYERYKETFKDTPQLLSTIGPEAFTSSFRFTLADRARADSIAAELRRLQGVDQVSVAPNPTPSPNQR